MGQKCKYMLEWRNLPKDIEEMLISDEYNENQSNDEEGESDN